MYRLLPIYTLKKLSKFQLSLIKYLHMFNKENLYKVFRGNCIIV